MVMHGIRPKLTVNGIISMFVGMTLLITAGYAMIFLVNPVRNSAEMVMKSFILLRK